MTVSVSVGTEPEACGVEFEYGSAVCVEPRDHAGPHLLSYRNRILGGVRAAPQPAQTMLGEDAVETLMDLARGGREADFRDLAACLGVQKDRLDALWAGTVARIRSRP